jgi:hypothetical protein
VLNYPPEGSHGPPSLTIETTKDPAPFEVLIADKTYKVDKIGTRYNITLPDEDPKSFMRRDPAMLITASKIREFTITSVE